MMGYSTHKPFIGYGKNSSICTPYLPRSADISYSGRVEPFESGQAHGPMATGADGQGPSGICAGVAEQIVASVLAKL